MDIRECAWCGKEYPEEDMYCCWDWLACRDCWNEMQGDEIACHSKTK